MPELAVFPVQCSLGSGGEQDWPRIFEAYPNGDWREYKLGSVSGVSAGAPFDHRMLSFEQLSRDDLNSILDFHSARMRPGGESRFTIYDFKDANFQANQDGIDLSGMDPTGAHTAIFLESKIGWTQDGPCSFSCSVSVKLLD